MADFGHQIVTLRKSRGISQGALAKRMGITPAALSRIENGRARPNLRTLLAIADSLQASVLLVPYEELPNYQRPALSSLDDQPAGSVFDDVFIPDPDEDAS